MTASLLNLLGQIHPVLRNLSALPLPVFVLVPRFTHLFMDNKMGLVARFWNWLTASKRGSLDRGHPSDVRNRKALLGGHGIPRASPAEVERAADGSQSRD